MENNIINEELEIKANNEVHEHDECENGCCCHGHHHEEKKKHHHHCACCSNENDDDEEDDEEEEISPKKIVFSIILFVCAILLQKLPFIQNNVSISPLLLKSAYLILYFLAYLISGLNVVKEAVENLVHGKLFGEEFLMTIATIGAICMGEYSEAVAVMILFQIGEYLEDKAVDSSRHSIKSLLDIRPDKANVKKGNEIIETPAENVSIGDVIVVKSGERIALDGKVISGSSMLDTSALTGESLPREVTVGDEVLSGAVNTSGLLEIKVSKKFGESTVSRILELVEKAGEKKASAERFITKFAKFYTPIVVLLALIIALVPHFFFGQDFHTWLYRALELLVVSCPCALVISVPLSFFAGIGLISRNGILVKGANYIEKLASADTVVFDKTGTLTKGVFEVTAVNTCASVSKDELLAIATHAEYVSNHPISRSLKNAHSCPKCGKLLSANMEEIVGHGIKCTLEGKRVIVGNKRIMEKEGISIDESLLTKAESTVVHVAVDGVYLGNIEISDVVKDNSFEAIASLKKVGVKKTVMLTGDSTACAESVGKLLGVDEIHGNLLPQDKVADFEKLLAAKTNQKASVLFVGDGINDSPVLARSDVGIAMGAMGSDAAVEAADVVIMDDNIALVSKLIKLSKKVMAKVYQNVIFSLAIKIAIITLCAVGLGNMWLAVMGDVGVTMLAVLNSVSLLAFPKKNKK